MNGFFRFIITILVSLSWGSASLASCYNNDDKAEPLRKFEVCLDGNCSEDVLLWECGSANFMGGGFDSGLEINCSVTLKVMGIIYLQLL